MGRRPRVKRGWDRGHVFTPAVKVRLGQRVMHRHVYYLNAVPHVHLERSVVNALHKDGSVTIQTCYGYARTVPLSSLFI